MIAARPRRFTPVLWWLAPIAVVVILRPWTVRPLHQDTPAVFDASTFAVSVWPRVVIAAKETATDVSAFARPGETTVTSRFVKGTGVVLAIDRQSRVGLMRVDVAGAAPIRVAIQIGPVIRGTAVRDASGFIQFSDFLNQFDFAGAANALNDYALQTVVGALPVDTLVGRTVTFIGAMDKSSRREDGTIEIVPVHLERVDAPGK